MSKDLSNKLLADLKTDRQESFNDLVICAVAKLQGESFYMDGEESIDDRIDGNLRIIQTIDAELKQRESHEGGI